MAEYIVKRKKQVYGPNLKIVGSPSVDNGIIKGFSTSSYTCTKEKFNPTDKPWEMSFCVKTGDDITTVQYFVGRNESGKYNPFLGVYNSQWLINISSDGSTWDVVTQPAMSHTINTNTWYIVKYGWDGSLYYIKTSEDDGISFIDSWKLESKAKIIPSSLRIGSKMNHDSTANSEPFLGSIDLNKSYIKINDEIWWTGMKHQYYNKMGFVGRKVDDKDNWYIFKTNETSGNSQFEKLIYTPSNTYNNTPEKNKSNLHAVEISDFDVPNYTKGVGISSGYVAPCNGYVKYLDTFASVTSTFYVNGVIISNHWNGAGYNSGTLPGFMLPVRTGDVITFNGYVNNVVFYPMYEG